MRQIMAAKVGVIRDRNGLTEAVRAFAVLESTAHPALANMATAALLVASAALARTESRGAHYRSDYPAENPALASRTTTTLAQARAINTHNPAAIRWAEWAEAQQAGAAWALAVRGEEAHAREHVAHARSLRAKVDGRALPAMLTATVAEKERGRVGLQLALLRRALFGRY